MLITTLQLWVLLHAVTLAPQALSSASGALRAESGAMRAEVPTGVESSQTTSADYCKAMQIAWGGDDGLDEFGEAVQITGQGGCYTFTSGYTAINKRNPNQ